MVILAFKRCLRWRLKLPGVLCEARESKGKEKSVRKNNIYRFTVFGDSKDRKGKEDNCLPFLYWVRPSGIEVDPMRGPDSEPMRFN